MRSTPLAMLDARASCAWLRALRAASQRFDRAACRGVLRVSGRRASRAFASLRVRPASGARRTKGEPILGPNGPLQYHFHALAANDVEQGESGAGRAFRAALQLRHITGRHVEVQSKDRLAHLGALT